MAARAKPARATPADPVVATVDAEAPAVVGSLDDLIAVAEADSRPMATVRVVEWPGSPTFMLRGLTGTQRNEMELSMTRVVPVIRKGRAGSEARVFFDAVNVKVVARALCKADGSPLVPEDKLGEVEEMLGSRTAGGLHRLFRVAQALSAMSDADVSELISDLKAVPSASSGTD